MSDPFLVVLPFHAADEHLAVLNLQWAISLDKAVEQRCLLVCPTDCDRTRVGELADLYFSEVECLAIDPCPFKGWPQGKNWAWQHTARHIYQHRSPCRWLWWEPDAVPLARGWLGKLEAGDDFLCHAYEPLGHIDSVAVYRGDVLELSTEALLCRAAPFEQVAGRTFLRAGRNSSLLASVWDVNGLPPTFKTRQDVSKLVAKGACLFHRCKDGSLVEVLSQGIFKRVFRKLTAPRVEPAPQAVGPCVISLGRYGDIINVLPVVQSLSQKGPVTLMVASKFADILQGTTYATPLVFDGDFTDVTGALEVARKTHTDVLVAQVNGRGINITCECDSFAAEAWRQLGHLDRWNDLPLVFDSRNAKREKKLWAQHKRVPSLKTMLVNFEGHSSPYNHPLLAEIQSRWSNLFEIVDLSKVKAQRIYDLLGLFDRADLLVTIDTATTHLAYGSSIPVINLITDTPTLWHGARPRGNSILALRYRESWVRRAEIHSAIERISVVPDNALLGHVFSDFTPRDGETRRRMLLAGRTWSSEYRQGRWMRLGLLDSDLPRTFPDGKRTLPYVRDLITAGLDECETIVLTNADICIAPGATRRILDQLRHTPVFYCHRKDFESLTRPLAMADLASGRHYVGFDFFCISRGWWRDHHKEMPDMLLGAEAFDAVLGHLMESTMGKSCCFLEDLCYHEKRLDESSWWEQRDNRYTLPAQKHNLALARKYFTDRKMDYKKWGIR